MFKTMCGVFAAFAVFFIAVNAMAQDQDVPKGRWWTDDSVVNALNLNNDEIEQIEKAYQKWRLDRGVIKGNIKVEQRWIDSLMENPKKNEAIIQERKGKIESARSAQAKIKAPYVTKVRNILGPARFEKLVNLKR